MNILRIIVLMTCVVLCSSQRSTVTPPLWFTRMKWLDESKRNEFNEMQLQRVATLMRAAVVRLEQRMEECMRIRAVITSQLHEEIAFEKGYVMGEIIETYRKALVDTGKQLTNHTKLYQEQERLRLLGRVQDAYMKVYHMTHMMHEVNPKFGMDNTGQIQSFDWNARIPGTNPHFQGMAGFNYAKTLNDIRDDRQRARETKVKNEKKIRMDELAMGGVNKPGTIKQTTNWWPVAYGWDIDYYW